MKRKPIDWQRYESEKREIQRRNLTPAQYEAACRRWRASSRSDTTHTDLVSLANDTSVYLANSRDVVHELRRDVNRLMSSTHMRVVTING